MKEKHIASTIIVIDENELRSNVSSCILKEIVKTKITNADLNFADPIVRRILESENGEKVQVYRITLKRER